MFILIYSNKNSIARRHKSKKYYITKAFIKNYNVIINGKNFYDQSIDPDIKRYKEIRKLTTRQGKDYNAGCLLDYNYIKNYYILITVDLSWQKELDAKPKAIQHIGFVGQLKNSDCLSANGARSMFFKGLYKKSKKRD